MNALRIPLLLSQIAILICWEAIGTFIFGWDSLTILAVGFVGLWTWNVLVASAIYVYGNLTQPQATVNNIVVEPGEEGE